MRLLRGFVLLAGCLSGHAMSLDVQVLGPSPAGVGSSVNVRAILSEAQAGSMWYRYRVRAPGTAEFRTIRDYSPSDSFDWAPMPLDGIYDVEITARNRDTGEIAEATFSYNVESRARNGHPVISATNNRLVFLYSAPPCGESNRIRVDFLAQGAAAQSTPWIDCTAASSANVYLAGLLQQTRYTVQHTVWSPDGTLTPGPVMDFATESLDGLFPVTRSLKKADAATGSPILLQSNVFGASIATDMDGNIVWYNADSKVRYLTRAEHGGYIVGLIDDWAGDDSAQLLRVYDLAGNVVAETNAGRVNEQLAAMGKAPVTSFHHEARMLRDGRIIVLAGNERLMMDVQGPGETAIIGDAIVVLNRDLDVEWFWDAFDHMDIYRKALLGETCSYGTGGCAVFRLASKGNDWLHGNSVQLTPDGHLLYSARHQDWLVKIDYANGAGSGRVIWRLGKDGDFGVISDDPSPWFSHQHDASFEDGDTSRLIVHDNGNTRWAADPTIHSRGQVFEIDEVNRTARLVLNADLLDYSRALGSAERLPNGNYHFGVGWTSQNFGQSLEFDPSGQLVSQLEVETQMYRGYRLSSMYVQ